MKISFNDLPIGPYAEDSLKAQWPSVTNIKGLERCQIAEIDGERVLQVTHAKEKLSPSEGGASWRYELDKPYEEFTVEYKVMLAPDFQYKRGGKLPGLWRIKSKRWYG